MRYSIYMTTTEQAADHMTTVVAEDAPIGVQLWPTIAPKYAPNYTLESVQVIRTANGSHVRWVYENGNTRQFNIGEAVSVWIQG